MMKRIIEVSIVYLFILMVFTSCDPSLTGDLKVFNQSSLPISVITFDYLRTDSLKFIVDPHSTVTIKILDGLGDQRKFDCCPCEFKSITMFSSNGMIKKDASDRNNWVIPNKDVQKKFGGEDLKCEFYIYQSDI